MDGAQTFSLFRTLFAWNSSVWRAVWKELLVWLALYYAIHSTYMWGMDLAAKKQFEKLCRVSAYYLTTLNFFSLSMFLGFYVSYVSARWWTMYLSVPWVDKVAFATVSFIGRRGAAGGASADAEAAQAVRREIVRHMCALFAVCGVAASPWVRKGMERADDGPTPGLRALVHMGLMTEAEVAEFERVQTVELPRKSCWWLPAMWAHEAVARARDTGLIATDVAMVELIRTINDYRDKAGSMLDFDFIGVPFIYTQVRLAGRALPAHLPLRCPRCARWAVRWTRALDTCAGHVR